MPEERDLPRLDRHPGVELDHRRALVGRIGGEPRDDRAPPACGNERLDRPGDVRPEDDVRLYALRTELGLDPREDPAGPVPDQGQLGYVVQLDVVGPPRAATARGRG